MSREYSVLILLFYECGQDEIDFRLEIKLVSEYVTS